MKCTVPKKWADEAKKIEASAMNVNSVGERVFAGLVKADIEDAKALAMTIFQNLHCYYVSIKDNAAKKLYEYSSGTKKWSVYRIHEDV